MKAKKGKRQATWGWGARRPGWLALWLGWLALTACNVVQPAPTLVPTLKSLPTPSIIPSPVSTAVHLTPTFAVALHSVTLESYQSFDFRQARVGAPTEGDLYFVASSPLQGSACFWANNEGQVGGRDLGTGSLVAFLERPLPRDRFSAKCISIFQRHVYVYALDGDARLAVLRVVDTGPTSVTFEYILHQ